MFQVGDRVKLRDHWDPAKNYNGRAATIIDIGNALAWVALDGEDSHVLPVYFHRQLEKIDNAPLPLPG